MKKTQNPKKKIEKPNISPPLASKNALSEPTPATPKKSNEKVTTKARKASMLAALVKTLGIVKTACDLSGVDRATHYKWLNKDEKYKAAVIGISDIALDFVESKLHKSIEQGNIAGIIFYMKTKGKERGYIERKELTGKDGEPLEPATRQVMIIGGKEVVF